MASALRGWDFEVWLGIAPHVAPLGDAAEPIVGSCEIQIQQAEQKEPFAIYFDTEFHLTAFRRSNKMKYFPRKSYALPEKETVPIGGARLLTPKALIRGAIYITI